MLSYAAFIHGSEVIYFGDLFSQVQGMREYWGGKAGKYRSRTHLEPLDVLLLP